MKSGSDQKKNGPSSTFINVTLIAEVV